MTKEQLEEYLNTTEKFEYTGQRLHCTKCVLFALEKNGLVGHCQAESCQAGKGMYLSFVKLLGSRSKFIKYQAKYDKHNLAGAVWDWAENACSNGRGRRYLKYSLDLMSENVGNRDSWPEAKDTIMHMGPDSFQLKVEREKTDDIFQLWWHLVKYQYNKRHSKKNED